MQNGFSDDLNELEISSVNVEPLNNREKLGRPVYKNLCPDFKERTACLHRDLISDWISLLLAENRERVENVDDTFKCFVNPKSVEYLFTVCLRLQLPPDVKYIALEIYNKFMTLHTTSLYEAINSQKSLSVMQKEEKWEQIFTTVSRQVALRILSSVQIASKLHSYSMGLTIDRVRYCLQLLGYAYTEQSIRKSEVRVLMAIGWCANVMQTPVTYIETFLHTIYRLNCHLEMNTRALWDYSLLIMDCIFLHSEEFYQRVAIVAHGNNAQYVPMKRLGRIEADYVLLASGVIVAACICVHGEDFVGTVLITLQRTTGIPVDSIRDFYVGIYQTIQDHEVAHPLETSDLRRNL
uniref:Cyclin N-terminal domain-containing protein n=1 Tax=Meloidogyne incognita TaxID=6306 RepID=A0A914KK91_MELIC